MAAAGLLLSPRELSTARSLPQQMEFLGRHIARKLNINYFDFLATSYRHVVRHWPMGVTLSPEGEMQNFISPYRGAQSKLDV